jgi:hypothetical protein
MNKLKLHLEDLRIDSFQTTSGEKPEGTVFGEQCTCYTQCTCPGCPTCDASCNGTCDATCDVSCNDTCASCAVTCYASCGAATCHASCEAATCYWNGQYYVYC